MRATRVIHRRLIQGEGMGIVFTGTAIDGAGVGLGKLKNLPPSRPTNVKMGWEGEVGNLLEALEKTSPNDPKKPGDSVLFRHSIGHLYQNLVKKKKNRGPYHRSNWQGINETRP